MTKDQSYGGVILAVSVIVAIVYLLSLVTPWSYLAIEVPVVLAVLGILGITAWIGYTMLTTPPPAPLESDLPSSTAAPTNTTNQTSPEDK